MRSVLVHGTFDPVTSGHMWLVSTGLQLFDRIVVAVAPIMNREPMFTVDERIKMWHDSLHGWGDGRVEVIAAGDEFEGQLAKEHGCGFVLAGVRSMAEYMERSVWQRVVRDLDSAVQSVYLFPDERIAAISASKVRALVGTDGWVENVSRYLQPAAYEALYWKFRRPERAISSSSCGEVSSP